MWAFYAPSSLLTIVGNAMGIVGARMAISNGNVVRCCTTSHRNRSGSNPHTRGPVSTPNALRTSTNVSWCDGGRHGPRCCTRVEPCCVGVRCVPDLCSGATVNVRCHCVHSRHHIYAYIYVDCSQFESQLAFVRCTAHMLSLIGSVFVPTTMTSRERDHVTH